MVNVQIFWFIWNGCHLLLVEVVVLLSLSSTIINTHPHSQVWLCRRVLLKVVHLNTRLELLLEHLSWFFLGAGILHSFSYSFQHLLMVNFRLCDWTLPVSLSFLVYVYPFVLICLTDFLICCFNLALFLILASLLIHSFFFFFPPN